MRTRDTNRIATPRWLAQKPRHTTPQDQKPVCRPNVCPACNSIALIDDPHGGFRLSDLGGNAVYAGFRNGVSLT
jgi:hypothetical protein